MSDRVEIEHAIDHLFRNTYGKVVSYLTASFGVYFLDNAQDIAQDALLAAYQNWRFNGLPDRPEAWIFKVAKNKALNVVRRDQRKMAIYQKMVIPSTLFDEEHIHFEEDIRDSMLRMIFACCHPTLPRESQITLILSTLCGFSRKEIAHALLSNEERIKKRLFRAKKLIREKNIQLNVPIGSEADERLNAVMTSLYLLFNEGYNASHTSEIIRKDLCLEAMRLCQLLIERFEQFPSIHALFALMCFHVARFESRIDDKGAIVLFKDQDRSKWNRELIKIGTVYLSNSAKGESLTAYHIEAQIAALHCHAKSYEKTDWKLIYGLYESLYVLKRSPIIQLNLAIITAKLEGVRPAIQRLENLKVKEKKLKDYYLLYATLGEFYKEDMNSELALKHFQLAYELTKSKQEQLLLREKMKGLNSQAYK